MDSRKRTLGKKKSAPMGNSSSTRDYSNEDIPEDNGARFCGKLIPEEILLIIFSYVPPKDLLHSVSLVCKYWHDVLADYHFWFRKLEIENIRLSPDTKEKLLCLEDQKTVFYILHGLAIHYLPLNTNLIRNPCGAEGLKYWKCQQNRSMITVESSPIGSYAIPEEAGLPTQHCFVTSYLMSCRSQTFHLNKLGISSAMMDLLKPKIYVSEWVSARFDCRSESEVVIQLTGREKTERVNLKWSSDDDGVMLQKWYKVETTITDYPDGLHQISYSSFGKDRQFWAGFYGSKTAGSTLKLIL